MYLFCTLYTLNALIAFVFSAPQKVEISALCMSLYCFVNVFHFSEVFILLYCTLFICFFLSHSSFVLVEVKPMGVP